jgi:hypothetical protein
MHVRLSSGSLILMALCLAGCGSDDSDSKGGPSGTGGSGTGGSGTGGSGTGGSGTGGGGTGGSGTGGSATGGNGGGGAQQIGADDIQYLGSFEVPGKDSTTGDESSLTYGGNALGYNPINDSLYYGGHDWYQKLAEVSIPSNFSQTATVLQDLADVTDGKLGQVDEGNIKLAGTLVYDGKLIVAASAYYDADANQQKSHFSSGLDLSAANDAQGPFAVSGEANTRSKAGYMTPIPSGWQSAFAGPALTGNCCQSIISASSAGPAATVFDPATVGSADPIAGTTVLFYELDNPTTGAGTDENGIYKQSDTIVGIAFPEGSSSVLFIGRHGKGEYCYGPGTDDQSLHGTPDGEGNVWCYDPAGSSKGTHAYPYVHQIWAYEAADLVEVKEGTREPWDVTPYAIFELTDMDSGGGASAVGAAFDPASGRWFFTEAYGDNPRVHVYQIGPTN